MRASRMIVGARLLSILWAAFWIWFGVASSFAAAPDWTVESNPMDGLVRVLPWSFWAIVSIVVAWRRPTVGGAMLLLEGLVLGVLIAMYIHRLGSVFLFIALAGPPIVSGLLYLAGGFQRPAPRPA